MIFAVLVTAVALVVCTSAMVTVPSVSPTGGHRGPTPIPLLGELTVRGVTCTLSTGACSMTIVNYSPIPLIIVGDCSMAPVINITSTPNPNPRLPIDTVTTWGLFNGTVGGPALEGIPAARNSTNAGEAVASCTIPLPDLSNTPEGSLVSGGFTVELASSWYSLPPGTLTGVSFGGGPWS